MADGGRTANEPAKAGLSKHEKQQQAIALRSAGATYREIGRALGVDHTWARQLVLEGLREVQADNVADLRRAEGARLDRMLRAVWPDATQGDHRSIHTVLKLMERRAKLFGLDAPVQVQMVDADEVAEVDAWLAQVNDLVAGEVVRGEVEGRRDADTA